ncbi:MAG: hypothetical protein AB7I19_09560 [Planctomycetota bacterium]
MSTDHPIRGILFAALLSAVPTAAQQPRDRGPAVAIPFFGTVTPSSPNPGGTGPAGPGRLLARKAGFSAMSDAMPPPGRPNFSFGAMFGSAAIRIDAFSIGIEEIHANCSGTIDLRTCNCWNMVLFAVQQGIGAATATGVVAQEHARPDGAGADVFSYVPLTAIGVNPAFVGVTHRAADSSELGLFRGGPTPTRGQIESLDMYTSLYELDPEVLAQLDPEPSIYFSIAGTSRDLTAVPVSWWNGSTPSGATILVRKWSAATNQWTTQPPLYTHADLGLAATADIDALAHNAMANDTVISLTRATTPAGLSQLLFVENCTDGTSLVDLTESDGTPTGTRVVADGTGIGGSGEVRGVCVDDPSTRASQPPAPAVGLMAHFMGTPGPELLPFMPSMDAQTYRSCDALGNATYTAHVVGLPPGSGPSLAVFVIGIPDLITSSTPLFTVPSRVASPDGAPASASFVIPWLPATLNSIPVQGMWIGIDTATAQLALSSPVTMFL